MASDKVLDNLQAQVKAALEAYNGEMGAVKIRDFEPAAAVGVCMAHDGEFVVARLGGSEGMQIGAKRYKPGDRMKLDRTAKAAHAGDFARGALMPDYVYDARRKYGEMQGHFRRAIEPALTAIESAAQEIKQGEALAIAARAQLEDAERTERDGRAHLEAALNQAIEALQYRPG